MLSARNQLLLGLLALGTIILGTWGFVRVSPDYSLLTATLAAFQLFALESGVVDGPVPWQLEVARWTAFAFSGGALFGIARNVAAGSILRARLFFERLLPAVVPMDERVVVVGLGRKGLGLITDMLASPGRRRTRVLGIDRDPERVEQARALGIDVMLADATSEERLRALPWKRTRSLVLLMGHAASNVTAALGVARLRGRAPVTVAVHVPNLPLRNLLARQNALNERGFRLFNYYERLARRVLFVYPVETVGIPRLPLAPTIDPVRGRQGIVSAQEQVPHVFIRPSHDFTPALVAALARSAHFPKLPRRRWTRIRVIIVGTDAKEQLDALRALHPVLRRDDAFALLDLDAAVPAAGQSAAEVIGTRVAALPDGTPVSVFLDVHEPGAALIESLEILDTLGVTATDITSTPPVDVRCIFDFAEEPGITGFLDAHPNLAQYLYPLPSIADCCGVQQLFSVEDHMDALAQRIHAQYDPDGLQPWDTLSLELQESNRAAADHVPVVLRALSDAGCDVMAADFIWDAQLLEALAECEHRRWAAQKLMAGWVPDASLGEGQDKARKRHGCVGRHYDDLSEPMRERDRANVRTIPTLLRQPVA